MINIHDPNQDLTPTKVDAFGGEYDSEITTIYGVISEASQSGHPGDDYTTHIFTLDAWKEHSGTMREKLTVMRPVENGSAYFSDVPKLAIVKLDLFLNESKNRAVMLVGEVTKNPDKELIIAREELQKPVTLQTDTYGTFTLDKKTGVFEADFVWDKIPSRLIIQVESEAEITDEFETIRVLTMDQKGWARKINDITISKLLRLKNDMWLADAEPKWSASKFISTYELESLSIGKNGCVGFWYNDKGIFGGHAICIEGTIQNGLQTATIVG